MAIDYRDTASNIAKTSMFDPTKGLIEWDLFGEKKRSKAAAKERDRIGKVQEGLQGEIDREKAKNPFESAAAKSAMAKASRGAKQMRQRFLNTMGAGASAESKIAAQGVTSEALGSAAGSIASGAEAAKDAKVAGLRGQKLGLEGLRSGVEQSRIGNIGSNTKQTVDTLVGLSSSFGDLLTGLGTKAATGGIA